MSNSQPFPFLRLPPELRLMVYERLSNDRPERVHFTRFSGSTTSTLTLVFDCRPTTSILATCRLVHQEAGDIVNTLCHQFAKTQHSAPHIEADTEALRILRAKDGIFLKILGSCRRLARGNSAHSVPWRRKGDNCILHECITQYGYQPTEGTLHAAQSLRIFIESAARALLFNKGPIASLSEVGRISIKLRKCRGFIRYATAYDLSHKYRIYVSHKLPQKCVGFLAFQRARSLRDLLGSVEFQCRWFEAITCSLDAIRKYVTRSASREEFKVFVVVGAAE